MSRNIKCRAFFPVVTNVAMDARINPVAEWHWHMPNLAYAKLLAKAASQCKT